MSLQFSATTSSLFTALFNVQQKCGIIGKDAENPHFKSEYVSLEKLWTTIKPLLALNNLMVIQTPGNVKDGRLTMETAVIHVPTGEFMISAGEMPVGKEGPQAVGSAITYARRYFLASVLSVVAGDEDDDGEAAEGRKPLPSAKVSDLRQRKEAALAKLILTSGDKKIEAVVSEILGRKIDEKISLRNEEEVVKLENAANRNTKTEVANG